MTCPCGNENCKLPPYQPMQPCPRHGFNTCWWTDNDEPIDSTNYSQQVYKETLRCGFCGYTYKLLRPCQFKPNQ